MKAILEKQTAILEHVEKNLSQDKLIQLSQVAEQAKLDRDLNKKDDAMISNLEKLFKEVKDLNKGLSKRDKELRGKRADEISGKADKIKTYDTLGDKFQAKKEKVKDFFTVRGFLDQTGIAKRGGQGMLSQAADRAEAKKTFIQQQLEVTKNTFVKGSPEEKIRAKAAGKQWEESQSLLKENKKNEGKIAQLKESGWGDDQIKKTGLLEKRDALTTGLKKIDKRFSDVGNEEKGKKETAKLDKKKEKSQERETTEESDLEAQRSREHQVELLAKIEENTRPVTGDVPKETKKEAGSSGGFLEMITNFLGEGFMKAIKTMFSPKNILKFLGKAFAITMVVGALVNGIMDGWKEFAESGDIGEALIKGLGGVLSFLTFGLFDAETVRSIVDAVSGFVDEYIIQPVTEFAEMLGDAFDKYIKQPVVEFMEPIVGFFKKIKDNIVGFITNFEIPKFGFKIPIVNKEVSFGPYKPFASDAQPSAAPEAPAPKDATAVTEKSANNAEIAAKPVKAAAPVVVNAPTNVSNSKQNIAMPAPIRNDDAGYSNFARNRFTFAN